MSKIEIDDAMVERAHRAYTEGPVDAQLSMRAALYAALNPPAGPEVEVTKAMCAAGRTRIIVDGDGTVRTNNAAMASAYRAMHAARPKEKPYDRSLHARYQNGCALSHFQGGCNSVCAFREAIK